MRHFEHHLRKSQNEWRWRDSKTAKSRSIGRSMSQLDPICAPDYYFEERGMKHFEGMIPKPSFILGEMNRRNMSNFLMEA